MEVHKIYFDMDGVLADFKRGVRELCGFEAPPQPEDVPEEERLCRVLLRDGYIGDEAAIREKYEKRYFPAERFYADKYRPAEKADLVIKR